MKRKVVHSGLCGPHAHDAEQIIDLALTFTSAQAQALSDVWELDVHPDYLVYCSIIKEALVTANYSLPIGWFEACFAEVAWSDSTKALHAIADTVMATLAKDLVATSVTQALLKPWNQIISDESRNFLQNEITYT